MNTYRLEYETITTHRDGGVMGTKHLVVLEAHSANEALREANRRFGTVGISSAKFKQMHVIRVGRKCITTRVRLRPVFV